MSHALSHHLLTMAYQNAWANHRLAKVWTQLGAEDLAAPRVSFFPSIRLTLNHILTCDWFYVDALEREQPDILGMSALLTTTMPYMKVVIDTMKEKGIRDDYVVLVGGAPLNEEFGKAVGADAYCRDAAVAVETAKDFISRKHNSMGARA